MLCWWVFSTLDPPWCESLCQTPSTPCWRPACNPQIWQSWKSCWKSPSVKWEQRDFFPPLPSLGCGDSGFGAGAAPVMPQFYFCLTTKGEQSCVSSSSSGHRLSSETFFVAKLAQQSILCCWFCCSWRGFAQMMHIRQHFHQDFYLFNGFSWVQLSERGNSSVTQRTGQTQGKGRFRERFGDG